MAYERTVWKNREVEYPRRYIITDNRDGTVTIEPSPGNIIEPGTPITAENMNNIEEGIVLSLSQIEDINDEFNTHKAKSVLQAGGVHGLEIESGTFTPYLYGTKVAGSHTYARQLGYYYRIGKLVHIDITIQINAGNLDTNMSGNLRIGGLPFVNASGTNRNVGLAKGRVSNFKYTYVDSKGLVHPLYEEILFFVASKNNYIRIVGVRDGDTLYTVTADDLATINTIIELSGTYVIA